MELREDQGAEAWRSSLSLVFQHESNISLKAELHASAIREFPQLNAIGRAFVAMTKPLDRRPK
jgi:hypothetical protein